MSGLAPGSRVAGRYHIVRKLGEGGVGEVWLADDGITGRRVAFKLVRDDLTTDADVGRRFLREARAASLLDHPGSVRVYDFGVWRRRQYIAMEYVHGRTLGELVDAEGALDGARAAALVGQLCDVLAAAHERDLLHRDLKLDNVLVTTGPDGAEQVKVVDFGLALLLHPVLGGRVAALDRRITREHVVTGTPTCMAPEQITDRALDARVDIYAVGCVLYELISGVPPFDHTDTLELLAMHLREIPPSPASRAPRPIVPAELSAIALWCLEKDPAARPQTAGDLARALHEAVHHTAAPRRVRRRRSTQTPMRVVAMDEGLAGSVGAKRLRIRLYEGDGAPTPSALRSLCDVGWLVAVRHGVAPAAGDEEAVDGVVIDLRVEGGWSALEAVAAWRQAPTGPGTSRAPIVVVGPDLPADLFARAFAAGADGYVAERELTTLPARVLTAIAGRAGHSNVTAAHTS